MNAIKSLSAAALALATVTAIASAPVTASTTILETLDRLESQGTSRESGFTPKVNTPEFLQDLAERATSKESGLGYNYKVDHPAFLQDILEKATRGMETILT